METILVQQQIALPADAAFNRFVSEFGTWWPAAYTWSQEVLEHIGIEPRVGGFCVEMGPGGFTIHWGTVAEYAPPARIVFNWQISAKREPIPNVEKASEVVVTFDEPHPGMTQVTLEHRAFERHGEGAQAYRDMMASEYGWPYIMTCYATEASGGHA